MSLPVDGQASALKDGISPRGLDVDLVERNSGPPFTSTLNITLDEREKRYKSSEDDKHGLGSRLWLPLGVLI